MLPANEQLQFALKSPWPPRAVSTIIIALIVWWGFINILPMFDAKKIIALPTTITITDKASPKKSLSKLDLFGAAEKNITVNKTTEAKQTTLKLILRGVLATDDPKQGIAQIQNTKKEERHFAVNDSIFGKATLKEIYKDRVILLHNGRFETLYLPKKSLDLKYQPGAETIASKTIQQFRNDLFTGNMEKYIFHVDYDSYYDDEGFKGFQIIGDSDKGKAILKKIGLADGDIVTEIDGVVLASNVNALKVVKNLRHAKKATIVVQRGGVPIYINLDFTK